MRTCIITSLRNAITKREKDEGRKKFSSHIGTSFKEGILERKAMIIFPFYDHRQREMNHRGDPCIRVVQAHPIYRNFIKKLW